MGRREPVRRIEPVTSGNFAALERLFGAGLGGGCWCAYWLIGPEYYKRDRTLNHDALAAEAAQEPPPGLLLFEDDRPIGWVRVGPRAGLDWLNSRGFAPGSDDPDAWCVSCFYVKTARRGRGHLRALLDAAIAHARAHGVLTLEGFPIDPDVPRATRNTFPGVLGVFLDAGFVEVGREEPARPWVRLRLG